MPPPGASEYASQSVVGDQVTPPTGSPSYVTRVGHPPSVGTTQTCGTPLRSDTNASRLSSGEKVGDPARPTFAIRATIRSNGFCALVAVAQDSAPRVPATQTRHGIGRRRTLPEE